MIHGAQGDCLEAWTMEGVQHFFTQDTAWDMCGGFTRFEVELEFVQMLGNPQYLNYLAAQHLLEDASFIAYLDYLQYFTKPEYVRYLSYPGPSLKALEMLQQEVFRRDILSPETVAHLSEAWVRSSGER